MNIDLEAFQEALLRWYQEHQRNLPWREKPSLYGTVVSEFMLQQTRVATVLDYYARWMKQFPGFKELAEVEETQVLKAWEGLGYYSRARNLHKLAKVLVGLESIPTDRKSWLSFPGIGPYTSAAITSISFGEKEAVVDGNVVRILARILGDDQEFSNAGKAVKVFDGAATHFLNHEIPGDHNQAMMELGATICLPKKPMCLLCPVRSFCKAAMVGDAERFPNILRTGMQQVVVDRALIIGERGVVVYRHPEDATRLAGISEVPELGKFTAKPTRLHATRKRAIGNQAMEERFFLLDGVDGELPQGCSWISKNELSEVTLSGPHRSWLEEWL
jgi:A/G-specific adenine glycosylase